MKNAQKEFIIHILILVLVQWISLAIVILNTVLFYISRGLDRHIGFADYLFLILGVLSFLASTVVLVFHLHVYYRLTDAFTPPRPLSIIEIIFALLSIILWVIVAVLMLTRVLAPTCKFIKSSNRTNHNNICDLFDTIIILAFVNLGGWILDLLSTLFILLRSPVLPTTIFTIEAPPQRFSHPLITPIDSVFFEKPSNKVYPDHPPQLIVTAPSTKSTSTNEGSIEEETKHVYPDQHLLHPDSYYTLSSLLEPISLELPRIQKGISQLDVSFI